MISTNPSLPLPVIMCSTPFMKCNLLLATVASSCLVFLKSGRGDGGEGGGGGRDRKVPPTVEVPDDRQLSKSIDCNRIRKMLWALELVHLYVLIIIIIIIVRVTLTICESVSK